MHIIITGASSGIGAALARAYAAPSVRLGLLGRNHEKLAALATELQAKGAETWLACVDVTEREKLAALLTEADDAHPTDMLIANAGISGGTFGAGENAAQARAIFATNLDGALNTIHPLLPRMQARKSGQIVLMASLAGFRGFPGAPAYCASKAALRVYGEGLRCEVARHGVKINVVCPGYVDTPMTQKNAFPMPFLMTAERAADIIRKGLAQNAARIAFPFPTALAAWLLGTLPPALTDPIMRFTPRKSALKV